MSILDVVPVARLEAFGALKTSHGLKTVRKYPKKPIIWPTDFRALTFSNLESFKAPKASNLATGTIYYNP